jgi:hypothetical protein
MYLIPFRGWHNRRVARRDVDRQRKDEDRLKNGAELIRFAEARFNLSMPSTGSKAGLFRHGQPTAHLVKSLKKFVAFLWQITPTVPVLPTPPAYKSFAVNKKRLDRHLHTVEVVGSNPAAPTIFSITYSRCLLVARLRKAPITPRHRDTSLLILPDHLHDPFMGPALLHHSSPRIDFQRASDTRVWHQFLNHLDVFPIVHQQSRK